MISLLLLVVVMALVTYIPRLFPLLWLKNVALTPLLKRFLLFTPYAVLASLIFPGLLTATNTVSSALIGGAVAVCLALLRVNLVFVVLGGIAGVYILEVL